MLLPMLPVRPKRGAYARRHGLLRRQLLRCLLLLLHDAPHWLPLPAAHEHAELGPRQVRHPRRLLPGLHGHLVLRAVRHMPGAPRAHMPPGAARRCGAQGQQGVAGAAAATAASGHDGGTARVLSRRLALPAALRPAATPWVWCAAAPVRPATTPVRAAAGAGLSAAWLRRAAACVCGAATGLRCSGLRRPSLRRGSSASAIRGSARARAPPQAAERQQQFLGRGVGLRGLRLAATLCTVTFVVLDEGIRRYGSLCSLLEMCVVDLIHTRYCVRRHSYLMCSHVAERCARPANGDVRSGLPDLGCWRV